MHTTIAGPMERSEAALASASAPKTGNKGPALGAETKAAFPFLLPVRTTRVRRLACRPAMQATGAQVRSGTGGIRPCNTAQEGGEASALGSNGWRVSDSALGVVLKAPRLRLGALKPLGRFLEVPD